MSPSSPESRSWRSAWGFFVYTLTHVDARVIGENAVVGEGHVFLLPLLVERVPAALWQDALTEVTQTQG